MAGVAKQLKHSDEMLTGSINNLKPEELIPILEKVVNSNDKISLSQASKDFLRARCFTLKRFTCSLPSLLEVVLPYSPNLLAFTSSLPLRNSDLKLLAQACPKLEALLLERDLVPPPVDVDFDDHGVSELGICKHLVEVVLSGRINVGDLGVVSIVRSAKKLRSLNLEGCVNVTDETLRAIGELTDLRYLNLKDCSRITDVGLKYIADGGLKSCLYNLSLSNCGMSVTDVGITAISHIESLWALDISMLANVTDLSLVEISSRCSSLHSIFLNGCVAITGGGFRALTNCGWIGELAVVNCPNITWDDVVFVGCALQVLEDLSLDKRMMNPVPEAGLKQDWQFGENHVQVIWK